MFTDACEYLGGQFFCPEVFAREVVCTRNRAVLDNDEVNEHFPLHGARNGPGPNQVEVFWPENITYSAFRSKSIDDRVDNGIAELIIDQEVAEYVQSLQCPTKLHVVIESDYVTRVELLHVHLEVGNLRHRQ